MSIGPASGRRGNSVKFMVDYCAPPNPNPDHLGCYRSELALQRDVQDSLIDCAYRYPEQTSAYLASVFLVYCLCVSFNPPT